MDNDRYPFAPPLEPGDLAAPRRSRRPRRGGRGAERIRQTNTAGAAPRPAEVPEDPPRQSRPPRQNKAQSGAPAAEHPPRSGRQNRDPRRDTAPEKAPRPGHGGSAAEAGQGNAPKPGDRQPIRGAQRSRNDRRTPRPAPTPAAPAAERPPHTAEPVAATVPRGRRGNARPPRQEEDPGLLLISRRPPKQKFSSFEEYIAAHGGVTAPLPEKE